MVRLSGPQAIPIGQRLFACTPQLGRRIRHVEHGRVLDSEGREIDIGLAWAFRGPRSYTGEDTVEVTCHGSMIVLETLVQAAMANGAVLAGPGEFTRRAFLNGNIDLVQAEAVLDVIRAESRGALSTAYGQASGRLTERVQLVKKHIVQALALLELGLDFIEQDVEEPGQVEIQGHIRQALDQARSLADTFEGCRRRQHGAMVALVGRPNVGKSTLLNALLGEDKAIVTPIPGTTRDLVEGNVVWNGEIIRLTDSAGFQEPRDLAEQEGVHRARVAATEADLLLVVVDGSVPWQSEDDVVAGLLRNKPGIIVRNKFDLPRHMAVPDLYASHPQLDVSALAEQGLGRLKAEVLGMIPRSDLQDGVGITHQRHLEQLAKTCGHLEAAHQVRSSRMDECMVVELQGALLALGDILGENVADEVLDRIFSEFCIGK